MSSRHKWSDEDVELLKTMYYKGNSKKEIADVIKLSENSVGSKIFELHLDDGKTHKHSVNFKADYQDYDWCFDKYIVKGMSYDEIADLYGYSRRVIQKWCSEKYGLNKRSFRKLKILNQKQKELVMFGILGDGHISKRDGTFIVSHASNQKDYLYWKYDILKDICNNTPYIITAEECCYSGKSYHTERNQYKFATRCLDELELIRDMDRMDIINMLNEFGLSIHALDDGSREKTNWSLCLAEYTNEEKNTYIKICEERFGIYAHKQKDDRYIIFDSQSSRKIDNIILNNIPNNLDIIKYKILNKD